MTGLFLNLSIQFRLQLYTKESIPIFPKSRQGTLWKNIHNSTITYYVNDDCMFFPQGSKTNY